MQYDSLNYNSYEDEPEYFTIETLISLCKQYSNFKFKFFDTDYTVGDLCSWRGSYDIPSITYITGNKTGKEIAEQLEEQLKQKHHGYKGGENTYYPDDVFYVSLWGSCQEFKVVGFEVDKDSEDTILLMTKIDKY